LKQALAIGLLAAALSACGGDSTELDVVKAGESGIPRVIVADVDSTINPYHEYLYAGSPLYKDQAPSSVTPEILEEFGIPPERQVALTRTGNFTKDKKADEAFWKSVRRNKMYWFKGTNVIAMSVCPQNWLLPDATDASKNPHGVGTSSSVLMANPEAILLFLEVCANVGDDAAMNVAFSHPSVDIVTTSFGAGVPGTGVPLPAASAWTQTFDGVVTLGKLHFSSGGNGPGLTNMREGAGPWWSIGVSGFEENSSNGREMRSGYFSDFVSDFVFEMPYCLGCERGVEEVGGTSFSTPRSAGIASRVLLEARRALGHGGGIRLGADGKTVMAEGDGKVITNWDLRRALEQGAYVPTTSEYDPVGAVGDAGYPLVGVPVNDEAPWLQVGWGDLTADPAKGVVKEALAALGFGTPSRVKDAGFCDFQTKLIEERILYWDNVAIDSGDRQPPNPNPFVFCGSSLPGI